MGLHPGALIGQNVRLVRPLSRGGMGSIWRAEHLTLHTEVAVKFVADALIGDAAFLARFTREAVASARIKSPHAVQIFDHGITADGLPYIVLELLEGEDLRSRLLRERKVSLETTVKIVTQVARGLARAHAADIVHRDIKPGNVFLMEQDGDLFVKILDFGIAKQIGDVESQVTMTGQIIGTPHYVSPEQIQRPREADPQSDLWSLAVVAYRCLTGELPFGGESVGAVAIAIDKAEYKAVTACDPSLPKMLDAWFERAFARQPAARFRTAKELAVAFDAASRNEPLPTVGPDSASFPLPLRGPGAAAEGASGAGDGAVEGVEAGARPGEGAGGAAAAEGAGGAPGAAAPGAAAQAAQPATETPRKTDTPLAMGEPTLSQGTVTQIERASPRRTRVYGVLAVVGVGGAIAAGVLSRGEEAPGPPAATSPALAASGVTAAENGVVSGADRKGAATATVGAAAAVSATVDGTATTSAVVSAAASAAVDGTATTSAAASSAASAPPAVEAASGVKAAPAPATAAPVKTAAPAASGTASRKKKDRGF